MESGSVRLNWLDFFQLSQYPSWCRGPLILIPTARKHLITLVKYCLPVICYLVLVHIDSFKHGSMQWLAWKRPSLLLGSPSCWGCWMSVVFQLVFSWPFLKNALALDCWKQYAKGLEHMWHLHKHPLMFFIVFYFCISVFSTLPNTLQCEFSFLLFYTDFWEPCIFC